MAVAAAASINRRMHRKLLADRRLVMLMPESLF
jgi:hypothetical protein